mmetsp:Transcript_40219/g.87959  ORF Transcript_40219/g.87959 Transcript_40219/m.87959 type:complete len:268 (+) Transcript_40219:210-1013(+)
MAVVCISTSTFAPSTFSKSRPMPAALRPRSSATPMTFMCSELSWPSPKHNLNGGRDFWLAHTSKMRHSNSHVRVPESRWSSDMPAIPRRGSFSSRINEMGSEMGFPCKKSCWQPKVRLMRNCASVFTPLSVSLFPVRSTTPRRLGVPWFWLHSSQRASNPSSSRSCFPQRRFSGNGGGAAADGDNPSGAGSMAGSSASPSGQVHTGFALGASSAHLDSAGATSCVPTCSCNCRCNCRSLAAASRSFARRSRCSAVRSRESLEPTALL